MKNRYRLINETPQEISIKIYRINYPFGRKSKPVRVLIKQYKIKKRKESKQKIKNGRRN